MKTLTVAELAHLLHVSRMTVYRMVRAGRIPHLRVGTRAIRFLRADVDALLASGGVL